MPLRSDANGKVGAVAEFYHSMENLGREIRAAKQRSWLLVTVATTAMYLLLLGMARRASTTIVDQQRDLSRQLQQLRTTLGENDRMRGELREAVARTTALNEQFLHRVAADLHDGPAQEISLALMRLEAIGEARSGGEVIEDDASRDFETIYRALNASRAELRNIASGLGMPKIADRSLADTVRRAVCDFEDKSGTTVQLGVDDALDEAPLAVRITVYRRCRVVANGWLHARAADARGAPWASAHRVADQPGLFRRRPRLRRPDLRSCASVPSARRAFEVASEPGRGTRILARLPLSLEETARA